MNHFKLTAIVLCSVTDPSASTLFHLRSIHIPTCSSRSSISRICVVAQLAGRGSILDLLSLRVHVESRTILRPFVVFLSQPRKYCDRLRYNHLPSITVTV
jgi:hypothetical protein